MCICSAAQSDDKGMCYNQVQAYGVFKQGMAFIDLVNIDSDYQQGEFS